MKEKGRTFFGIAALIVVVLDQLTKWSARNFLQQPLELASFFSFRLVTNTGAGFGILQGYNIFLIIISLAILFMIFRSYTQIPKEALPQLFTALIVGGAVGNVIDRIAYGAVTDFIAFSFWPAFNVADAAVTVGALGWIVVLVMEKKK